MALIPIDRDPEPRKLRLFGLFWLIAIGALGWVLWRRTGSPALAGAAGAVAVLVPVAGWIFPPLMRWVYLGLSYATWPIGWVVSHTILAAVYYLVLTPLGLGMRLLGRDPLSRRLEPEAESYWLKRRPAQRVERYFRQF